MKLINLLIRKLDNCSLGSDFGGSHHAEIYQSDRFSLELNFKRASSCNHGIPRLVQVKKKKQIQCRRNRGGWREGMFRPLFSKMSDVALALEYLRPRKNFLSNARSLICNFFPTVVK